MILVLDRPRRRLAALGCLLLFLSVAAGRDGAGNPDHYPSLEKQLRNYLAGTGGRFGIYLEDIPSGATLAIQADEPFVAASTIKVPLVLYLYTLAYQGRINLNEEMALAAEDLEGGTGYLRFRGAGHRCSLRDLAAASCLLSDNTAANALFRRLGRQNVYDFIAQLGARVVPTGPGNKNLTTPRDMALAWKALLDLALKTPQLGGEVLGYLAATPFDEMLAGGLPRHIAAAHKTGTYGTHVSDAGVIFLPGRPYILAVYAEHDEPDEAMRAIATVSRMVYRHQAGLLEP